MPEACKVNSLSFYIVTGGGYIMYMYVHANIVCYILYCTTVFVSTLKGTPNLYFLSEVLTTYCLT